MNPEAWLDEALSAAGLDSVEGAFAYAGGTDLTKPALGGRRRTRIELTDPAGRPYVVYLKRYEAEGLIRRWRRRWTYGSRAGPASVEADNIRRLRAAGVPTMQVLRIGQQREGRGFLVTSAVPGEALERCAGEYLSRGGEPAGAALAGRLAELVARLHQAGYAHRDLYASHVFLDDSPHGPSLYLIDLARVFVPRWRRFRWWAKDLAALKFSMPPAWVERHWEAFLRAYLSHRGVAAAARYNRRVDRKARAMARRQGRKQATGARNDA